jgi:hypothetical protein
MAYTYQVNANTNTILCQLIGVKALLWCLSTFINFETWDNKLINGLDFVQNYVLQLPFFLMTLMKYLTPTLDDMQALPLPDTLSNTLIHIGLWIHYNGLTKLTS